MKKQSGEPWALIDFNPHAVDEEPEATVEELAAVLGGKRSG